MFTKLYLFSGVPISVSIYVYILYTTVAYVFDFIDYYYIVYTRVYTPCDIREETYYYITEPAPETFVFIKKKSLKREKNDERERMQGYMRVG